MSCKTILPANIDEVINALDLVGCEKLSDIREQIRKIENFNNALKIDEEFLSLMVDEYQAGMFREFESDARKLLYFAGRHYPKLGTLSAVKKVFEALGISAKVEEWFEYDGEPYHFKVKANAIEDEKSYIKLVKLIGFVKNIRSVLDSIGINKNINSTIYRATIIKSGQKANIYLKINPIINASDLNTGVVQRKAGRNSIGLNIPKTTVANTISYFGVKIRCANKQTIGVSNG